jgi:hypothetical protein
MAFLIEVLTAGAKAAFPMLSSLAESGLSANEILRQVKDAGFSVQRQAGLDVIGALRENVNAARYLRLISPLTIPDPAKFGVAITNTLSNFSYIIKATGINSQTGERIIQNLTVRSNTPISQSDAMSVADSYLGDSANYQNIAEYSLDVTNVLRNANYAV